MLSGAHVSLAVVDEFIGLLSLCLIPNFCQFEGIIFTLADGVPTGSPLAALVSGVFMNKFEKEVLDSARCWYRYVDDVLCM